MGSRLHGNDERRRAHPQSSARIHAPTTVILAKAGIHGTHNRHSRDGGNPRRGVGMGSRLHGNDERRRAHPQSSARIHAPTTVILAKAGIHGSHNRHSRDGGNPRWGPAMGSRLHGNDGRRRRTHNRRRESTAPQSSFPRRRESTVGAGDGFPSARERRAAAAAYPQSSARIHAPQPSFPRRRESTGGAGDGFPSARERRAAAAHPQSSARIHVPTIVGGNPRPHNRHSRDGGNPRGGGGDGFPSARERRAAAGAPTIVGENPRTHNRHSRDGGNPRGGGRRWVPVCTGTTGGDGAPTIVGENPRTHNRHSREGGNPRGGAGDGFPSARERREAAGAPTIVGENPRHPQSSFPRRRESTARVAMGSRLHGNDGRRRAHPQSSARIHGHPQSSFSRRRESTGGGPAMGSRLHGNDGRRRAHPQSSFPRRRESTGGPAMGSRLHGNDGRRRAHPQSSARIHGPTIVIPAKAGIHGGGPAVDGFPSARERREAAGAPTIVGENPRPHNRHSRDGGNPRRGPAMGSRLHGNDGRRRAHPQTSFP